MAGRRASADRPLKVPLPRAVSEAAIGPGRGSPGANRTADSGLSYRPLRPCPSNASLASTASAAFGDWAGSMDKEAAAAVRLRYRDTAKALIWPRCKMPSKDALMSSLQPPPTALAPSKLPPLQRLNSSLPATRIRASEQSTRGAGLPASPLADGTRTLPGRSKDSLDRTRDYTDYTSPDETVHSQYSPGAYGTRADQVYQSKSPDQLRPRPGRLLGTSDGTSAEPEQAHDSHGTKILREYEDTPSPEGSRAHTRHPTDPTSPGLSGSGSSTPRLVVSPPPPASKSKLYEVTTRDLLDGSPRETDDGIVTRL